MNITTHTSHDRVLQRRVTTFSDGFIAVVLFVVALLLIVPAEYKLSFDFSKYITIAGGLFEGYGFAEPNGRPAFYRSGYTLTLAGLQGFLGRTLHSAVALSLVATAFLTPLTYLIGVQLRERAAGVIAALLIGASPNIIMLAPRHLDPVWPALLLLALLLLLAGIRRQSTPYLMCSAAVVAYAITIKELSGLFVLAALWLMIIHRVRWGSMMLAVMTGLIVLMIWLIFVATINGGGFDPQLLVNYNDKTSDDLARQVSLHGSLFSTALLGLKKHFLAAATEGGFLRHYGLGLLLSLSLIFMPVVAWRRRCTASVTLASMAWVFLPLAIVAGARDMRLMQTLWIQLMGFISLALLIIFTLRWLVHRLQLFNPALWITLSVLMIIGVLLFIQVPGDTRHAALMRSPRLVTALATSDTTSMRVVGAPCYGIGEQLADLDPSTVIYSDHKKVLESIRWEAPEFRDLKVVPHLRIDPLVPSQVQQINDLATPVAVIDAEHPSQTLNNRIKVWTAASLNTLNQHERYIVVITQRARGLERVIRASGAFKPITRVKSRWQCWIYQPRQAPDYTAMQTPIIGPQLPNYLSWLKAYDASVYTSLQPSLSKLGIRH